MAFFLITETDLPSQWKNDYPNGNAIVREDYQKSFTKEVRWKDTKSFLKHEGLGEVYPSYSNSDKDRYVCRPSLVSTIFSIDASRLWRWQMFSVLKRCGLPSMRGATNMVIFLPKKVNDIRIFYGRLVIGERWRTSYDGGGFHTTIPSLGAASLLEPRGACTESQSGRECPFVIIM